MQVNNKKSFWFSLVLLFVISLVFWTQSRFPALDEKSQMGQRTNISALAFDVIVPLSSEQNHAERIAYTAINWGYTNWKGMTFGLLFAAAFLSLLSFLKFRESSSNQFINAIKGSLLGTPLGVCANCSTPVAFGMYRGGMPATSAISMLSSSPTLNIIVLTMSFTLLPLEMVVIKYLAVLIFVWCLVPLLVARTRASFKPIESAHNLEKPLLCNIDQVETWTQTIRSCLALFGRNLFYIVKRTVPFMLLAGLLGAIVIEFVSIDPILGSGWTLQALFLVALLAAFFPVPIAFDVIVCVGLLAMGVANTYIAAIYFALGVFSIYPALMIARDLSLRLSLYLMLTVVVLAMFSGLITEQVISQSHESQMKTVDSLTQANIQDKPVKEKLPLLDAKPLVRQAARLCHRLGEPEQYTCFGQFVVQVLSTQFSKDACFYLEDALAYKEVCEANFEYLRRSQEARSSESIESCALLSDRYRLACEYDLAFEQVANTQDLSYCNSLNDGESKLRCINEGLVLNIELFDNQEICGTIGEKIEGEDCIAFIERQRIENKLLARNDINACLEVNDGSSASAKQIQYCQGVLMVNQLEQGADLSLCDQVQGRFLKKQCAMFYRYLEFIRNGDIEACSQIEESSLKGKCVSATIQHLLLEQLENIRFDSIDRYQAIIEGGLNQQAGQVIFEAPEQNFKEDEYFKSGSAGKQQNEVLGIKSYPFTARAKTVQKSKKFVAVTGQSIGLNTSPAMQMTELFEPFNYGRGISAGDFNLDQWPDLVMAHHDHVSIYQNKGGTFQEALRLQFGSSISPMLVALADLNNDAWPELLVSFYGGESRIYGNQQGLFDSTHYITLKPEGHNLSMSVGFADPDKDGDLDMVLGGWSFGDLRHFNPVMSQNYFAENITLPGSDLPQFKLKPLAGVQGETLSVLLSDLNNDGVSDLVVANDLDSPDVVYTWRQGRYQLTQDDSLPQISSLNTMSLDSGDLNGDQKLDYFSVDMTFDDFEGVDYCLLNGIFSVEQCRQLQESEQAVHDGDVSWCAQYQNPSARNDCLSAQIIQLSKQSREGRYCEKIPKEEEVNRRLCAAASMDLPPKAKLTLEEYPKSEQQNVLLISGAQGFSTSAKQWNALDSYWSWNAKIADLDNDGWQDIYIGNGFLFGGLGRHLHSNVFLHNQQGSGFKRAEKTFGLEDYLNTPSFVYIDFDLDGDLDIIAHHVAANPGVFINQTDNNSIRFSLVDSRSGDSNVFESVVGAKVSLQYSVNKQSQQQVKELKLSGGFLSFDPVDASFGLASEAAVEQVNIQWPDGELSVLKDLFRAGLHYQITRRK